MTLKKLFLEITENKFREVANDSGHNKKFSAVKIVIVSFQVF